MSHSGLFLFALSFDCAVPQNKWSTIYYFAFPRKPINVVVGKPIPVPKIEEPSTEQIEEFHQKYVDALVQLYNEYNPIYGDPKISLILS